MKNYVIFILNIPKKNLPWVLWISLGFHRIYQNPSNIPQTSLPGVFRYVCGFIRYSGIYSNISGISLPGAYQICLGIHRRYKNQHQYPREKFTLGFVDNLGIHKIYQNSSNIPQTSLPGVFRYVCGFIGNTIIDPNISGISLPAASYCICLGIHRISWNQPQYPRDKFT